MIYVIVIVGMFVIVGIGSTAGLSTGLICLIGIAFCIALVVAEEKKKGKKLKNLQNQTANELKFNEKTGVITLTKRHASYSERFTLENYISTRHGYAQEKLIFTSATVGGVTTGGVDKVGGYGTEKMKTDKYNLIYEYLDPKDNLIKKGIVKRINLSDNLLEKAKNSKIKNYLDGKNIIVVTPLVSSEKEMQAYLKLHQISGGGYTTHIANLQEDDKIKTLPTAQKCSDIINWISGK